MSCGYSPTPPAACAWSAHSPSKPTKTGSKPTATSIWTNCASRRKPNYAKPHDQHHDRQFAELDAHNRFSPPGQEKVSSAKWPRAFGSRDSLTSESGKFYWMDRTSVGSKRDESRGILLRNVVPSLLLPRCNSDSTGRPCAGIAPPCPIA